MHMAQVPAARSPRPAKRGEGAEVRRTEAGEGLVVREKPSPGSRCALATLSRCAGEGKPSGAREPYAAFVFDPDGYKIEAAHQ
jgi:hypothetical protein